MSTESEHVFRWLKTGADAYAAMFDAIAAARQSVRLEIYAFADWPLGEGFREELIEARRRGARVQVLIDAGGSHELPDNYWDPVVAEGGEFRWFNPLQLTRFTIRDHRKLLVCDERTAIVGGFNLTPEYEGDGVARGWRDLGLQLEGPVVGNLTRAFDEMFARAERKERPFVRLRKSKARNAVEVPEACLLLGGPGSGHNPLTSSLKSDLKGARSVQIISAYFLPTWRLRRALVRVVRHGGRVQLVLAGKSDVPISQLASRGLYQRLLNAGVEISEYQPQILHSKLIIIDDIVYVGSANLDPRSLNINYELLIRLAGARFAVGARELFADHLAHAGAIDPLGWRRSRTLWNKLREHWAHFLLARVDPFLAMKQLHYLR